MEYGRLFSVRPWLALNKFGGISAMKIARISACALQIAIAFSVSLCINPNAVRATESDDVGFYGSVNLTRKAKSAAEHMKKGEWGEAQADYRALIGLEPKQEDFYVGLYKSSFKMNQWDQVSLALEELCSINPTYKDKLVLERGECNYHLNRYTEAEPQLKLALSKLDQPSLVDERYERLMQKSIIKYTPKPGEVHEWVPPIKFVPEVYKTTDVKGSHLETSEKSLTLENAFNRAEKIVVADFAGYEGKNVTYFAPPKAIYKIDRFLIGSALNKTIFVRYEFHNKTNVERPKDFKFSPDTMPQLGSKWILFIDNAVPIDGMYQTYKGSFGRVEYNDENLDKILQIIDKHKGQAN